MFQQAWLIFWLPQKSPTTPLHWHPLGRHALNKKKYQYDDLNYIDNTCHRLTRVTRDGIITNTTRYAFSKTASRDRSRDSWERVCRGGAGKGKSDETCKLNSKLVAPIHYWQQGSSRYLHCEVLSESYKECGCWYEKYGAAAVELKRTNWERCWWRRALFKTFSTRGPRLSTADARWGIRVGHWFQNYMISCAGKRGPGTCYLQLVQKIASGFHNVLEWQFSSELSLPMPGIRCYSTTRMTWV